MTSTTNGDDIDDNIAFPPSRDRVTSIEQAAVALERHMASEYIVGIQDQIFQQNTVVKQKVCTSTSPYCKAAQKQDIDFDNYASVSFGWEEGKNPTVVIADEKRTQFHYLVELAHALNHRKRVAEYFRFEINEYQV